ncbi:MAG: DsrE family protein [Thermodesulfovibrionales bacterium]
MKLGIMATRDSFKKQLLGIVRSASSRGHEVIVFLTDDGVNLCLDSEFQQLIGHPGVTMSLCDHSAKLRDISEADVPAGVVQGSQFQNAVMNQDADKVIII